MSVSKPITAFGEKYLSFRDAASAFGIPESTLRFRLEHGLEPEAALVCHDEIKLRFIALNDRAYHWVSWSSEPTSTREIVENYRPDLLAAYDADNPRGEYRPYRKGGDSV